MAKFKLSQFDLEDVQDWIGSGEAVDSNRLSKLFSESKVIGEYDE